MIPLAAFAALTAAGESNGQRRDDGGGYAGSTGGPWQRRIEEHALLYVWRGAADVILEQHWSQQPLVGRSVHGCIGRARVAVRAKSVHFGWAGVCGVTAYWRRPLRCCCSRYVYAM